MNTVFCESLKALRDAIETLQTKGEFIWRGQSSSAWQLSTSVFRHFEQTGMSASLRKSVEENAVGAFLQSIKHYDETIHAKIRSRCDALVIMQHYGCPTRLLDFTCSPYIGLYFALAGLAQRGALYGLNLTEYQAAIAPKLPLDDYDHGVLTSVPDRIFRRFTESHLVYPIPFRPPAFTVREREQQTMFLFDMLLDRSIEESMSDYSDRFLWKLEFTNAFLKEAYYELELMNIDGGHLFQGIQGAAVRARDYLAGVEQFGHTIRTIDIEP